MLIRYNDEKSEAVKWMKCFFVLSILRPEEVRNGFTELIPDAPNTNVTFPDYVLVRGFRIPTNIMAYRAIK
jgi:hypothetical protein